MALKENVKVIPSKITNGIVDQMWAMKSVDLCVAALPVPGRQSLSCLRILKWYVWEFVDHL